MKLRFEKLTRQNLNDCLTIKHLLFPESNSDEDYEKYFSNTAISEYFVVYFNNQPCAITGWYDFDNNKEDAFMGWFGVLPNFRQKGIGSQVFDFTVNRVKEHKYNYFRLYTDIIVNKESVILYTKKGMLIEPYTYDDALGNTGNFVVFTTIIKSNGNDKWNNRPLNEDCNYNF